MAGMPIGSANATIAHATSLFGSSVVRSIPVASLGLEAVLDKSFPVGLDLHPRLLEVEA
jgi:hypothetical protein